MGSHPEGLELQWVNPTGPRNPFCPGSLFFVFFFFLRAAPEAYGGSQARGRIGAVAVSLHHSHSNAG